MSSAIETERAKAGIFFDEDCNPGVMTRMEVNGILHKRLSKYQDILVLDTYFGPTLVTDGKTQSAKYDEHNYHESLVHPSLFKASMLASGAVPSTVFIGGGGELATAREVLRHKSIKRVVMVDLDEEVIGVCKEYLPEWGGEDVLRDPRFELVVGDAFEYLMSTKEKFDVIILDISDPIEAGPGIALYTKEVYTHATKVLHENGVLVTQAGTADIVKPPGASKNSDHDSTCFGPILNTLASVFDYAIPYAVHIPSFGGTWGFVMAYKTKGEDTPMTKDLVDSFLARSIIGGHDSLHHYDGMCHEHMFSLSKSIRKALAEDKRIMTMENPIFMW